MRRAIELAARGMFTTGTLAWAVYWSGTTWSLARVIVRPGEGHAEVNALASVNGDAVGATAYVSWNLCHFGRTRPAHMR